MSSGSNKVSPGSSGERRVYVALGSNLGDSVGIVLEAMGRLQSLSDQAISRSSLWQSAPVDCPPGSPPFVNAVVAFVPRPEETPRSLLAKLKELEKSYGRTPKRVHNEPRPIDLDLIAFGNVRLATQELTLPHPRARLRRFVLAPLAEIAPHLVLPGHSKTVEEMLADLPAPSNTDVIRIRI